MTPLQSATDHAAKCLRKLATSGQSTMRNAAQVAARWALQALPAPVNVTPRTSAPARRGKPWRPCGYPGCNPGFCEECSE